MEIDHIMRRVTDAQRAVLWCQRMLDNTRTAALMYERWGDQGMADDLNGHISWLERQLRYYEGELELAEADYQTALEKAEIGGAIDDQPTAEF